MNEYWATARLNNVQDIFQDTDNATRAAMDIMMLCYMDMHIISVPTPSGDVYNALNEDLKVCGYD